MNLLKRVFNKLKRLTSKKGRVNYKNTGTINLVDIGAVGDLPEPWFDNSFHVKNLLRFEPNEKSPKTGKHVTTCNFALSNKNETRDFYIYKGFSGSGSSFYEQNIKYIDEHWDDLKNIGPSELANTWHERSQLDRKVQIKCKTLDTALANQDSDISYDFVKIDAQGAEYEILSGAEHFLSSSCLGLQLELFNFPILKGIKLDKEVEAWLSQRGFYLAKTFPPHGSFNCSSDFLFLREDGMTFNPEKFLLIKRIYGV